MQRFLLFILVVVFACIVFTRAFMGVYEPVDYTAAVGHVHLSAKDPVFDGGRLMMEFRWSKGQLVYFCKLIIVVVIALVAVLNYRTFVSEKEEH